MPNFVTTYEEGKAGLNKGSTTGLSKLDRAINGIQKGTVIGLAAAPKAGKTTLCDFSFVLMPYLEAVQNNTLNDIEWIYYSYEISRIDKEFKFASFFMYYDFQISSFIYKGKEYGMSAQYLQGKLIHVNEDGSEEIVAVSSDHEEKLKIIYRTRIVPLFGEYDANGRQISKGKITFFEERNNPTGMWKYLLHIAEKNGRFVYEDYVTKDDQGNNIKARRIIGYNPNNKAKKTIVVTDHIRRLKREKGYSMKENIDKWLEYATDIRKICDFIFIHIIHSNRNLSNVEKLKFFGQDIFPTADEVKDSGNVAEECTILMTLFNPNDEKYNLEKHMGVDLSSHPNYRSLHITESRNTECPVHIQLNMYGGINYFDHLTY